MSIKTVKFDLEKNTIHEVYSSDDYNRQQIHSMMYLKSFGKISSIEWTHMLIEINIYKIIEMSVHNDSVMNTKINNIKLFKLFDYQTNYLLMDQILNNHILILYMRN
jgi:hypothetical protein